MGQAESGMEGTGERWRVGQRGVEEESGTVGGMGEWNSIGTERSMVGQEE